LTFGPWVAWLPLPDFDIIPHGRVLDEHNGVVFAKVVDDLCAKSFLVSAILLYNFETLTLAYFH
jgi:hypothetical protein